MQDPVFGLLSILLKRESPGPVFYQAQHTAAIVECAGGRDEPGWGCVPQGVEIVATSREVYQLLTGH